MARVKLSEYRAKTLIADALGRTYMGSVYDADNDNIQDIINQFDDIPLVVKVDQATKKRNKSGLVKLNRTKKDVISDVGEFVGRGFRFILIEPMVEHDKAEERFIALMRTDNGIDIKYSLHGGVDVEEHAEDVTTIHIPENSTEYSGFYDLDPRFTKVLCELFSAAHMTYLEINPLIISDKNLIPLDAAVEVDSAAELAVKGKWSQSDLRSAATNKTDSEKRVEILQATSPASLTLRVLNPDGKIFLLLSGGGASIVVADEFSSHGLAHELVDYGEYSGNPNEDELYAYTTAVIDLIKKSHATKKVLVIAGGIANFTDIAVTFRGIIRALSEHKEYFKANDIPIYIRRGGPNQEKGLAQIKEFLKEIDLKNSVYGPEMSIAQLVDEVSKEVAS